MEVNTQAALFDMITEISIDREEHQSRINKVLLRNVLLLSHFVVKLRIVLKSTLRKIILGFLMIHSRIRRFYININAFKRFTRVKLLYFISA